MMTEALSGAALCYDKDTDDYSTWEMKVQDICTRREAETCERWGRAEGSWDVESHSVLQMHGKFLAAVRTVLRVSGKKKPV